ncbi:MAG: hypothetical protein L0229_00235 [Blastocatellia bacterium]|nr:hypothetical protein [Blastocatellia bacterium]
MPNKVEVGFVAKDENLKATLTQIERQQTELARSLTSTGQISDRVLSGTARNWREVERAATSATEAQERAARALSRREAALQTSVPVTPGVGRGQLVSTQADRSREFALARQHEEFLALTAQRHTEIAERARRSEGATRSFGRSGVEAFNQTERAGTALNLTLDAIGQKLGPAGAVTSQFGSGLQLVGGGFLALAGTATAAIAALAVAAIKASEDARKAAESELQKVRRLANQFDRQTFKEQSDELARQRALIEEINETRKRGAVDALQIQQRIRKEFPDLALEAGAGGFEVALRESFTRRQRQRAEAEAALQARGDRNNIFDQAGKPFKEFAGEFRSVEQINRELDRLRDQFRATGDVIAYEQELKKLATSYEEADKRAREAARAAQEFEERQRRARVEAAQMREALRSVDQTLAGLRAQTQNNPFVSQFEEARISIERFKEQVKDLGAQGREAAKEFEQLTLQNLSGDVFRARLASGDRLLALQKEQAFLRAGQGGQGLIEELATRDRQRGEIIREIESRRREGTLSGSEQLGLLARLNQIGVPRERDLIEEDFRRREIQAAEGALSRAQGPAQQAVAVERILQATSDISRLSEQEITLRRQALEQSIRIEEKKQQAAEEFQKKQVEIQEGTLTILQELSEQLKSGAVITIKDETTETVEFERLGIAPRP